MTDSHQTQYTVRNATETDLSQIYEISASELGREYLSKDQLESYYTTPTATLFVIEDCHNGEKTVVGFCIGSIYNARQVDNYLNVPFSRVKKYLSDTQKIGVLQTIAILQSHQELGLGSRLVSTFLNRLHQQDVYTTISLGWKRHQTVPIKPLLVKYGFSEQEEFTTYWKEESENKGYSCSVCGDPPCVCSAVLLTT
jgi:ribosomal protein S18 acetylase RimI-like enzyme